MNLLAKYPGKTDWLVQRHTRSGEGRPRPPFLCLLYANVRPGRVDRADSDTYHRAVQPVISAEQMRLIDRLTVQNSHVPSSLQLMEAAAEACFTAIDSHFAGALQGKTAQVLCGPGNNGGDGAALARKLAGAGVKTDVILFGQVDQTRGDARTNFDFVGELSQANDSQLTFVECATDKAWPDCDHNAYDIVVDALFGTGLNRPLDGIYSVVVNSLLCTKRKRADNVKPLILSVDVPSGLDADKSAPIGGAVDADMTVTFTAPKVANVLPPASHLNGRLIVADIGSPKSLIADTQTNLFVVERRDVQQWLIRTRYTPDSFKNSHGHVLVVAGARGYTGAAVLCGNAAMRSGVGLVTLATPASIQSSVAASAMPEVMTVALAETDRGAVSDEALVHVLQLCSKATVVALGPGLSSQDDRTRRLVYSLVKQRTTPVVVDADGLNCLAEVGGGGWPSDVVGSPELPIVLTPHPGEMMRLMGVTDRSIVNNRILVASEFAKQHDVILLLKGSRGLIASPDGRVFINPTGNAGAGTAGAGDTLTGVIAGFIAQDAALFKQTADVLAATISGLYLSGVAADMAAKEIGMRGMVASDIRENLGHAIKWLDPIGEQP